MLFEVEVRKVADVEIRVEARDEAHAKQLAEDIAIGMDQGDWWEEEISVVRVGRAYEHHEHAIKYDGDFLVCDCGNNVNADGFSTTNTDGVEVEPEPHKWDGKTYRCDQCGSVKSVEKVVV
jgi:hypothetical protein